MTSVYLREQGAMVRKRGERLVVTKQGEVLQELPLTQVDQVVVMGNVQLTTQAMSTLVRRGIDVVFTSSYGKYKFRPEGEVNNRVALRQQQLARARETAFSLEIARQIVIAKIHNQRVVLQRLVQRNRLGDRQRTIYLRERGRYDQALVGMSQMTKGAEAAATVDSLRGYEGKAAAYYFGGLRAFLGSEWGFRQREYYPPPDPINALLSFLYSLLLKEVRTAVYLVGLDIYQGFFHEVTHGRPSLALDLMEEWRPLVADSVGLELINQGSITLNSFVQTGNPKRPIELTDAGIDLVLAAHGQRLQTRLRHPLAGPAPGGETTLKQAIVLQTRLAARVIEGRATKYEGIMAK